MRFTPFFLIILALFLIASKNSGFNQEINSLHYLGKYDIPHHQAFRGTTIGGLSGIDYDSKGDLYYLISDDRSALQPARFYTARIFLTSKGIDSVRFQSVSSLLQPDGTTYPAFKTDPLHTPDPEAIRYNASTGQLVWTSEGERIIKESGTIIQHPSINVISTSGEFKDSIQLPLNTHMHAEQKGPRQNGGFESLSFSPDFRNLFYSVELPLFEDGPEPTVAKNNAWVRIFQSDVKTGKNTAQYAYALESVAHAPDPDGAYVINGISDLLSLGDGQFIVVERSFATGRLACTIRLYLTDIRKADNIIGVASLTQNPPLHYASKKLLLNMDDLGIYTDNIEGVTFGPTLPNGHRTLVFIADDNFKIFEKSQLLLFEVL